MRNYFPAEDCLLKIKVHRRYGAETHIRASVRRWSHIAQLPPGVSRYFQVFPGLVSPPHHEGSAGHLSPPLCCFGHPRSSW